jgi:putative ABC transport system permease protein
MALGIALITTLFLLGTQIKERLYRDGAGIDVVIGAKGSPLQLILSSIQHIDIPTGNIDYSAVERIKAHPHVKKAIPISLGDSHHRFRIVGTEYAYLEHFNAKLSTGTVWQTSMQAVIGARVAAATNMQVGSNFVGAHGFSLDDHHHDQHPYKVVGILEPTGTVLDRLIITSLESVWDVHEEPESDAHENHDDHDEHEHHHHEHEHEEEAEEKKGEVTALLVSYSNRAAILSFPRMINRDTAMQAASPAFEMARLADLMGVGTDVVLIFSSFLVILALASVLIGLLGNIRQRRYDLAIFRTLGASRKKLMLLVIMEGMIIALLGIIFGMVMGHAFVEMVGLFTTKGIDIGLRGFILIPQIWLMYLGVLLLSLIVCFIPAWEVYRADIRHTLIQR